MSGIGKSMHGMELHTAPGDGAYRPSRPPGRAHPSVGYWQEWTPTDPQPNNGYDAELHLPAGTYLLNASANIVINAQASGPAAVECSLFVGETNVSLHQLTLSPGEGESISATSHVDSAAPTVIQWVCSSTTGPMQLHLAVTALKVDELHHIE
jgi:hypothetical protein